MTNPYLQSQQPCGRQGEGRDHSHSGEKEYFHSRRDLMTLGRKTETKPSPFDLDVWTQEVVELFF